MNFQEFLSNEEMRQRSVGANLRRPRFRAVALHTRMKGPLCDRMPIGNLGNVGFEAVLVDSEALDL